MQVTLITKITKLDETYVAAHTQSFFLLLARSLLVEKLGAAAKTDFDKF
jgi:hypothetical protein